MRGARSHNRCEAKGLCELVASLPMSAIGFTMTSRVYVTWAIPRSASSHAHQI